MKVVRYSTRIVNDFINSLLTNIITRQKIGFRRVLSKITSPKLDISSKRRIMEHKVTTTVLETKTI